MRELIYEIINAILIGAILGVLLYYNMRLSHRIRQIERKNAFLVQLSEKMLSLNGTMAGRIEGLSTTVDELAARKPEEVSEKIKPDPFSEDIARVTTYSPSPKERMEQKRGLE